MNLKKLSVLLAGTAALWASHSFAAEYEFLPNFSSGYDLPVNELQTFNGHLLRSKTLSCQVRTESRESNPIEIVSLKHRSVVNGVIINEGSSAGVVVHAGDHLTLEMDARGKLGLTNQGQSLVNLKCK